MRAYSPLRGPGPWARFVGPPRSLAPFRPPPCPSASAQRPVTPLHRPVAPVRRTHISTHVRTHVDAPPTAQLRAFAVRPRRAFAVHPPRTPATHLHHASYVFAPHVVHRQVLAPSRTRHAPIPVPVPRPGSRLPAPGSRLGPSPEAAGRNRRCTTSACETAAPRTPGPHTPHTPPRPSLLPRLPKACSPHPWRQHEGARKRRHTRGIARIHCVILRETSGFHARANS